MSHVENESSIVVIEEIKKDNIEMVVRLNKNSWFTEFMTRENGKLYIQSAYNFEKELCYSTYNLDHYSFLWTRDKNKVKDILVCWHWVGSFARYIDQQLTDEDVRIVSIDLNETMIELSKKYFEFSDRVEVIHWDALEYLRNTDRKFDVCVYDIYNVEGDESFIIGFQNKELFEETCKNLRKCVKEDGILMMNYFQYDHGQIIDEEVENVKNTKQIKNFYEINEKLKELFWENVNMISKQSYGRNTTSSIMYWADKVYSPEEIIELNKEFWFKKYDVRIEQRLKKYVINEKEITKYVKEFIDNWCEKIKN